MRTVTILMCLAMSASLILAVGDAELNTLQVNEQTGVTAEAATNVAAETAAQATVASTETSQGTSEKSNWATETPEDLNGETTQDKTDLENESHEKSTEHLVESENKASSESKIWDEDKPQKVEPACKQENWKEHNLGKCLKAPAKTLWTEKNNWGPRECWREGKQSKGVEPFKYWNRNCVKRGGKKHQTAIKSHKLAKKHTKLVSHHAEEHKHCSGSSSCPSCERARRTPKAFERGLPKDTPARRLRGSKSRDDEDEDNDADNDDEDEEKDNEDKEDQDDEDEDKEDNEDNEDNEDKEDNEDNEDNEEDQDEDLVEEAEDDEDF
eukprot:TRINITY_DN21_c0_g1_i2.p1 TRINITY_DN21_c0_g1~~TRINITY_DN21_c0_g1_i2.p1  ORF type:complete len:325 (+),score=124.33 TRINITY_DN21_c0_g1_i2:72-1046(+)